MKPIVPQLSKCLKFEEIWEDQTKRFVFNKEKYKKTCVCIVVQRMAQNNHLIHLNYPDLSFVNLYGDKKSQERYLSTCIQLFNIKHPSRKV